jgi:hypothetical protein
MNDTPATAAKATAIHPSKIIDPISLQSLATPMATIARKPQITEVVRKPAHDLFAAGGRDSSLSVI